MMLKLALATVLLCFVNVHAIEFVAAGTGQCNAKDFKSAQDTFAGKLGLPTSDDWQQPMVLFKAIQDYYGSDNKTGIVNVCNAFNALLNDLNTKNIDPATCFDPLFLLSNDDTPDDAVHFAGVVGALRFQCGAGFYPVAGNWACASRAFNNYSKKMYDALSTVLQNAEIDRINRCQIIKDGEINYYKPLHDQCSNAEITYFGCQSYNRFFNAIYAECGSECQLIA